MTDRHGSSAGVRVALLAAALSVLGFMWSLRFGFVYDDRWTLTQNGFLDDPLRTLLAATASGSATVRAIPDATRPAMIASMWLDRRFFGAAPFGYHLHSLLLYAATVAAAATVARAVVADRTASTVAAVLFALAPLHAEVVCAINFREDLISALGILIPVAWLFRPGSSRDSVLSSFAVAVVFGWGLLGKESTVALLPLVLALALIVPGSRRDWLEARERTLLSIFAVFLLWLNWRVSLATSGDGIPRAPAAAPWLRLCDAARYELQAVASSLAPFRASPEYGPEGHASFVWLFGVAALLALIACCSRGPRSRPIAVGLAIALVAPVAASPLVGPANVRADRYVFVGVLGGGIVVGVLAALVRRRFAPRTGYAVLGACVVVGLLLSRDAALVWQDERSLWTYATVRAPGSPRAWAALSRVERLSGNLDEADRLVDRALAVDPKHVPSRVTRVYNFLARGRVLAAREEIGRIERSGAAAPRGLTRARLCAAGSPEAAPRCIGSGG